ncbi:hypothetical protein [Flavobacterium rhizosphaerae]|uniref:Uncharacterized protein n=1 Tax=Flavobacterium rhizosphaerae TaxID=3163298 RepID=A0ABW8Z262_9FLAO
MTNSEQLKLFASLFYKCVVGGSVEHYGKKLSFKIKQDEEFEELLKCTDEIFELEQVIGLKYEIDLKKVKHINSYVFYKYEDFFRRYEEYKDVFYSSNILILQTDSYILKIENEKFRTEKGLVFNYPIYRKLLSYLKHNSEFATIQDQSQFVLVSKDFGVFNLGFKTNEFKLKEIDNLEPKLNKLKTLFEKKEFIQFFKENILSVGLHKYDINDRLIELIKHIDIILNLTERDYENYVLNFSFEKVKAKFKDERNKYFENLDKNIELVNKQVLSLPLTFAASVFAAYQIKDKSWILFLILLVYIFYTIIANRTLNISKYSLDRIDDDVKNEKEQIEKNYHRNFEDFKRDFTNIENKISKIKNLTKLLNFTFIFLLIIFTVFVTFQVYSSSSPTQTIQIPIEKIKLIEIDSI